MKLKKKENIVWQRTPILDIRAREDEQLNMVAEWVQKYLPEVDIIKKRQPRDLTLESFCALVPKLSLVPKGEKRELVAVKAIGADFQTGAQHLINLDCMKYIQNNSKEDIWIAYCIKYSKLNVAWIKPEKDKVYKSVNKDHKGFVCFNPNTPEYYSPKKFVNYIKDKMKAEEQK